MPSDVEPVQQHPGPLEDATVKRLRRRVLPANVRLVWHVTPDLHRQSIELLPRAGRVDGGKGHNFNAFALEPSPQRRKPAETDRRRSLDRGSVPFELNVAARGDE